MTPAARVSPTSFIIHKRSRTAFSFRLADKNLCCYTDKHINAYCGICMQMSEDTTRWTVSVSKETDITVRSFLAQRGMKKGDLSKFIEEAVKWRVLDQTMTEAR